LKRGKGGMTLSVTRGRERKKEKKKTAEKKHTKKAQKAPTGGAGGPLRKAKKSNERSRRKFCQQTVSGLVGGWVTYVGVFQRCKERRELGMGEGFYWGTDFPKGKKKW